MKIINYSWRKTKIICTLGPATDTSEKIAALINGGMNIARVNLSHGNLAEHTRRIGLVRKFSKASNRNTAILIDLPGPKYRIGKLAGGSVELQTGQTTALTAENITGNAEVLPVNLPNIIDDVKPGDSVLLADGELELKVEETRRERVICRIVTGGTLGEGKGVVIPLRHISAPYLTDQMKKDIKFAISQEPDFLALSFVATAGDVQGVRNILKRAHLEDTVLVSKIERAEALNQFDDILSVSDAVMVARGDLGVEIPLERVPMVQKDLINRCNQAGKPVITATEMLESMVSLPRPTRAEAADVANAIFDGTDAIMLSQETTIGKYPIESLMMMSRIANETEKNLLYESTLSKREGWCYITPTTDETISYNASHTANILNARAIIAYTQSGSTARRVSKYRPRAPILALTPDERVFRRLIVCWGVFPVLVSEPGTIDQRLATATQVALQSKLAKKGDLIVITAGLPAGKAGNTNMLKVQRV